MLKRKKKPTKDSWHQKKSKPWRFQKNTLKKNEMRNGA
jgi:hypothetical protein